MAVVSPPYWPHCLLTPLIDDSLIGVNYADLTSAEHLPAMSRRALAQIVITNLTTQSLTLLFVIVIDKYKFITKGRFKT